MERSGMKNLVWAQVKFFADAQHDITIRIGIPTAWLVLRAMEHAEKALPGRDQMR